MKNNAVIACLLILIMLTSCNEEKNASLSPGLWRGVIKLQEQEMPFNFEVIKDTHGNDKIVLINAEERLELDSVKFQGDSIFAPMHLFDNILKGKIDGQKIHGEFIKNYADNYKLPFEAQHGENYRFKKISSLPHIALASRFKVHFADEPDSVYGVGIINQKENKISATILTITGDHRYLEGDVDGDSLFLSSFDGEHLFLYKAKINADSSLTGHYWSGRSYNTAFTADPEPTVELVDAEQLTFLKPGYDKLSFSFPGLDNNQVSLDNAKYKGKVVIIQLLGSWCPNCMDESKFLAPWHSKNKSKGVEIIGLAYEKKDDFNYAKDRVQKMKMRLGIEYDLAVAGTSDKVAAATTLPMLSKVIAFPTTIFIDKTGKVRKIHTGFSGPGTGKYYEQFVEEFNSTIAELLKE